MMKYAIFPALAAGLACAGCNPPDAASIVAYETAVQADVIAACGVTPVLATLAALFGAKSVAEAAAAICASVAAAPVPKAMTLRRGHRVPAPVVIDGKVVTFE